jgi:hypothetical protein
MLVKVLERLSAKLPFNQAHRLPVYIHCNSQIEETDGCKLFGANARRQAVRPQNFDAHPKQPRPSECKQSGGTIRLAMACAASG